MRLPCVPFTVRWMMVAVSALGALVMFAFWSFVLHPQQGHVEWYRDVEDHIVRLADSDCYVMAIG
jgi:hypothetical protein